MYRLIHLYPCNLHSGFDLPFYRMISINSAIFHTSDIFLCFQRSLSRCSILSSNSNHHVLLADFLLFFCFKAAFNSSNEISSMYGVSS